MNPFLSKAGNSLLNLIKSWVPGKTFAASSYIEFPVGAGFYAMRQNTSASGKNYFNLVKRDRSGPPKLSVTGSLGNQPTIGSRTDRPATRRARRNVPIAA